MDAGLPFHLLGKDERHMAVFAAAAISGRSFEDVLDTLERTVVSNGIDTDGASRFASRMEPIRFSSEIRYWNPERAGGLAVVDLPPSGIEALGGLKQQRVHGRIGSVPFTSNVMPAGGGRLSLSVSKAMMKAAGVNVGDVAEFELTAGARH